MIKMTTVREVIEREGYVLCICGVTYSLKYNGFGCTACGEKERCETLLYRFERIL